MKKETASKDLLPISEDSLSFFQLDSKEQVSKKLPSFGETGLEAARARDGERFRAIEGFSRYRVGDAGTVQSTIRAGRIMRPWIGGGHDYLQLSLMMNDGSQVVRHLVHRLVAVAFVPNPLNLATVNHRNGIKIDNRAENLEWVSYGENNEHARQTGLNKAFGSNHWATHLTRDDIVEIRRMAAGGIFHRDIAEQFGIGRGAVTKIINRRRWRHVP